MRTPKVRSSGARSSTRTDPWGWSSGAARRGALLGGRAPLGSALGAAVQVGRADLAAAEQLETLLEDVLELLLGATLEEHVPVRAGRLFDLGLGLDARGAQGVRAAARALPDGRNVGLDRHRDLEGVPPRAQVADLLTGRELDAALVLETLAPEARSS